MGKGISVEQALQNRKSRVEEERRSSVEQALEDRKKRISSEMSSINKDLIDRYNASVSDYNSYADSYAPKYGMDIAEELGRQRDINLSNKQLISDVEAYRSYLGSENADAILENLRRISEGYKYSLDNFEYFQKMDYDLDAGKAEIDGLNSAIEEYDGLSKSTPIVARASADGDKQVEKIRNNTARQQEILQSFGYESYSDMKDDYAKKSAYYNQAKLLQGRAKISKDAMSAPDFREYADKGASIENPSMKDAEGWLVIGGGLWNEDNDGIHIGGKKVGNIVTYSRENADAIQMGGAGMVGDEKYSHMTTDEVDIYNYYLAKEKEGLVEKGSAQKYLDSIEDALNQRSAGQRAITMEDKPALELLFGVEAGLDQFRSGISNLFNTEDDYIAPTKTQYTSALVREDLADVGGKFLGSSIGQGAYDLITTTTNMMPSILASTVVGTLNPVAGTVVGAGLMGGSAAGNAYQEMLNAGYDKDQARVYSALTGASEAGLQYALGGIGKLGGKLSGKSINAIANGINNAGLRFAVKFGGEMASEGLEEFMQDVLDPYFKSIATGEIPENVDWEQAFYSGMLGALSAGVLNGVNAGINKNAEVSEAKRIIRSGNKDALVDVGKTFDAETIAYKLADKVTPKTGAWKLSQLLHEVNANLGEQTQADIKNALVQKGMTETDAGSISKWLAKAVEGGNLTRLQQKALEENDVISSVFKEVVLDRNSTVNQRIQGMMNYRGIDGTSGVDFSTIDQSTTNENLSNQATSHMAMKKASDEAVARMLGIGQNRSENEFSELDEIAHDIVRHSNSLSGMKTKSTIDSVKDSIASDGKVSAEDGASIKKIQSIKDGRMVLELTDGSEVDSRDVVYKSDDQALLYESVLSMGYSAESANAIVNGYSALSGLSASEYLLGVNEAYNYGKIGYPLSSIKTDGFISDLTDTQKSFAYGLGMADADGSTKSAQNSVNQKKTDAKKKGRVVLSASVSNMTDIQKASISAIGRVVSDVTHNNVVIYESVSKDGRRVFSRDIAGHKAGESAPNGFYDPNTGAIYIDINAGNNGEGAMLWTVAHEMTHFIRQWSPEKFKVLADFLMQEYGKNGVDVQTLIENQIAKAKRAGRNMSFDAAYEEVVADSMSSMFTDTNMSEKLAKLKAQDQTLWEKMKGFFADLYNRIKEAYKGLKPQTQEAMYVKHMMDTVERISDLFAEALVDAGDAFSTADATLTENGISVDSDTDSASILSVRDVLDDKKRTKVIDSLMQRFGVTKQEAERWISAETSLASLILNPKYSQYLDYEADPDEDAIKKNLDYPQGTVDFSTICAKRREFTSVMNGVLRNFPKHIFAATDLAKIRTIMQEEGMTIPCSICYVEDRRQLDTIVAQDFIDGLKLYREGSKTRPDGKPFNERQLNGLKLTDGETYVPSVYELVTLEGRNQLKAKNPNMEAAWVKYNNARGMKSVRLLTNEAEYKRQILGYSKSTVKSKNDHGGLRIYSFSDAEMFHLIDIIQVITDSATVGLSLQGYTKVNEYAKAVKDTGEKLNRSLIPKGELGYHIEDGKVVLDYDTVEGIDINSEDFFDNKDNPNIGNITIGVSDVQIREAMLSDFVDQIIPFHTGQSADVLGEKGIATWSNYKDYQTDKDIATGNTSKHQVNIYTEVLQVLEEEGKPINKRTFVEKFLEVCKENGLTPRFSQFLNTDANGDFVYTEGYHKLLVDFKTFAQTEVGEYLPQMPVKPIFDNAYITKLLIDYVQSQKAKDADIAKSMPRVIERITNEIIKPSEKYSGRDIDPISEETYEELKQHFGTTNNFRVAGYLLKDGTMLDFSGKHWGDTTSDYRQVDHRDVNEVLEYTDNYDAMVQMIGDGNIRLMPESGGINLSVMPTTKQIGMLEKYIRNFKGEVLVDFDEPGGDTVYSRTYRKGTDTRTILRDIDNYFKGGKQSELMQFHTSDEAKYSDRETEQYIAKSTKKYGDVESAAIEHFGTTDDFRVAGYILRDGQMLDFSGAHWLEGASASYIADWRKKNDIRQVDHEDVYEAFEISANDFPSDSRKEFINRGNIRVSPEAPGINIASEPTSEQYQVIRELILDNPYNVHGFYVDIESKDKRIEKLSYSGKVNADRVINDIKYYYATGSVRNQSELMQFHTSDEDVLYSVREEAPPKKTIKGYKVFFVKDGKLYPPMVANPNGADTPVGVWLNADIGTQAPDSKTGRKQVKAGGKGTQGGSGSLAFRPGWHLGEIPLATQFDRLNPETGVKELFPENFVWAECDVAADIDYQEEAMSYGYNKNGKFQHSLAGLPKLPTDGYYRYRTNPNPETVPWLITGAMKVNRLLSDAEVNEILTDKGIAPKQRQGGNKTLDDLGLSAYKDVKYSDRDDSSLDTRTLLSNALATTAQNEIESKYITQYQEKIATINAEQKRLAELRARIKELSFAKGTRDAEQIRKLQEEATKIANRISTYDKQLLKLEATKPLRQVLDREKAKAKKKAEKEGREALDAYRKRAARTQRELMDRYKERTDRRKATELRNKVKKYIEDFRQRLQNPTERHYVPAKLVSGIIDVYDAIDPTGVDQESKASQKYRTAKEALAELKLQYDGLKKMDYEFSSEFNEEFSQNISDLADAVGDTPLREMDRKQLEDVYSIIHDIAAMIKDATKQIGTDEAISNYEAGQELISDMAGIKGLGLTTGQLSSFFREWTENPMRAVREMSGFNPDSRLVKLFDALNEGRRKADTFSMKSNKKFEALRSTKEGDKAFSDAVEKASIEVTDFYGDTVYISKMQAMQAILTFEREMANENRKHLSTPVKFTNVSLDVKGKYTDAFDRGYDVVVDAGFVARVMDSLSEWDKDYLALARQFFNEDSKNAINEVSMITKHRLIATEKAYIPYYVNQDYIAKESDNVKFDASIEGIGILKSVKNNAPQQLVIRGLNSVIDDHISKVAKVYGLSIPIRNWNKVFNMMQTKDDGGKSVKVAIREVWKDGGVKLLDQAVADMQSNRRYESVKALSGVKSAFVTSTLASNISVWMKQAASYPTAGAILSTSALTKALPYFGRNLDSIWDEIDEHTSQHWIRRKGMSTQELGEMNQTHGWQNKLNKKLGVWSPMNWIQAMDVKTTAVLWIACKNEIESSGLTKESDGYWDQVTELYDKVIEDTQPMYDSLHRAEITKNAALRNIVMFQTQPIQNSGILREGAMEYKMAKKHYGDKSPVTKEAGRNFRKAVGSQLASHFVFTAMTLLAASILHKMNQYRDDDDELNAESIAIEFSKQFGKNFFGAVVPVFGNYGVSIAEKVVGGSRYDVLSDPTVDKINSSIENFARLKNPSFDNFIKMACDVASYFGIPAQNVYNIINGARLHVEDAINGEFGSFEADVDRSIKQDVNRMYNAFIEGDTSKMNSVMNGLIEEKTSEGKTEKEAKSSIKSSVTSNYKPIFLEAYSKNDTDTMSGIRRFMKATGLYEDVVKTTQDWIKNSKK